MTPSFSLAWHICCYTLRYNSRCSVITATLQVMKLAFLLRRRQLQLLVLLVTAPFFYVSYVVQQSRVTARYTTVRHLDATNQLLGTTPPLPSIEQRREMYREIRRRVSQPSTEPLRLKSPGRRDHSQHGQSRFVDDHLRGRRNGFFVESGASDGETGSNSLFFERYRNWTGLLVEANPQLYRQLLEKRRHAYAINACISPPRRPVSAIFKPAAGIGGLADQMSSEHLALVNRHGVSNINVTCYSINDIIAALNIDHIDYWSLDVEGAELAILGSLDWTSMPRVDVISVEYMMKRADGKRDQQGSVEKLQQIRQLFDETAAYQQIGIKNHVDVIFART